MCKRFVFVAVCCFCLAGLIGCEEEKEGRVQDLGAISVRIPEGWTIEPPSSRMRKAQYVLPRQGQDPEDASLVVFHFGPGQGGSVEANLKRWYGQFRQPDGRPSGEVARVTRKTVSGMRVTAADVSGTYAPAAMGPMVPAGEPKPNFRMLAAIVESPQGPYFFKLTGPEGTVGHWKGAFDRFIESVRKK